MTGHPLKARDWILAEVLNIKARYNDNQSTCKILSVKLKHQSHRISILKLQDIGSLVSVEAGEQQALAIFPHSVWFINTADRDVGHESYLLVISNEYEVLAVFTQSSNGVSLKHLCCLFYNDNLWLYVLQDPSVFCST